jgi:hypothetical protein
MVFLRCSSSVSGNHTPIKHLLAYIIGNFLK